MSAESPTYRELHKAAEPYGAEGALAEICVRGSLREAGIKGGPVTVAELHEALRQMAIAGVHPDTVVGSLEPTS